MRFLVAALLIVSTDASAVPAYVPSLGTLAADPVGACTNGVHYVNSTTGTERCCNSTAWGVCTPASSNPFAAMADTAIPFVHPVGVVTSDVSRFSYGNGTGQISLAGPSQPGVFATAVNGGALSAEVYADQATGNVCMFGDGAGVSAVQIGAKNAVPIQLQTSNLTSVTIRADRVVEFPQPMRITSADVKTSCVLNGATPATCVAVVSTVHACTPFCTLAAPGLTTPGCVRVGTNITVTAGNGDTQLVNILCL